MRSITPPCMHTDIIGRKLTGESADRCSTLMMSLRISPANQRLVVFVAVWHACPIPRGPRVHPLGGHSSTGWLWSIVSSVERCYVDRSPRPCVHRPVPAAATSTRPRLAAPRRLTTGPASVVHVRRPFELDGVDPPCTHFAFRSSFLSTITDNEDDVRQRGRNERDSSSSKDDWLQARAASRVCGPRGVSAWQLRLNYVRHRLIDPSDPTGRRRQLRRLSTPYRVLAVAYYKVCSDAHWSWSMCPCLDIHPRMRIMKSFTRQIKIR